MATSKTPTGLLQAMREEFAANPSGGSKYFQELGYGASDASHCCAGLSCVLHHIGFTNITGINTVEIKNSILAAGGTIVDNKWTEKAQAGDVLLFHWDSSTDLHSILNHVGVFEMNTGSSTIQTVEFNGNKARKNGVFARYKSNVAYVLRLPWAQSEKHVAAWYQQNGKWYHTTDGVLDKFTWVKSNDKWYYIGASGYAVTDEWVQTPDGSWYYFGKDGYAVADEWVHTHGQWYYVGSDGKPVTGWTKIDGAFYHFDDDAVCEYDTFAEYKGEWGWLGHDGKLVTDKLVIFTAQADSKGVLSKIGVEIKDKE